VAAVLAVVAIAAALALAVAAVTRNEGLAALRAAQVVRVPDPDIEPAGYKQPEGVARPSRSLGPPLHTFHYFHYLRVTKQLNVLNDLNT
jgi:hypothetical protein